MGSWIKLHRRICEHPFYRERRVFSHLEAWIDLLLLANHENHKFLLGGQMIEAQRGEIITSELKLMERWRWSKAKVRRYIACLVDEKMVIKKATHKKTSIFIVNFDTYQKRETTEKPQKNHRETTDDTQSRINKNYKEYILRDSPNPAVKEFIDWWFQKFKEKFQAPYVVTPKDGNLVKRLLKSFPLEDLKSLALKFFESQDSFIVKAGFSIGVFQTQINKLTSQKPKRNILYGQ